MLREPRARQRVASFVFFPPSRGDSHEQTNVRTRLALIDGSRMLSSDAGWLVDQQ